MQLSNYKNRWYSPKLGRFLQNDPIHFSGGDINLYRYCVNDPINVGDPMGLEPTAAEAIDGFRTVYDVNKVGKDLTAEQMLDRLADGRAYGATTRFISDQDKAAIKDELKDAAIDGALNASVFIPTSWIGRILARIPLLRGFVAFPKIVNFSERNLNKGFVKHGVDFGLSGNWSKARGAEFAGAVNRHINTPGIRQIFGSYRGQSGFTFYLNTQTGVNVVVDSAGNYVTGYKLGANQLSDVLTKGFLW
jgi:hypothetical protein